MTMEYNPSRELIAHVNQAFEGDQLKSLDAFN
jgi:hypothetical protein